MDKKNSWKLEISSLFKSVGLHSSGEVEMNPHTYDFNPSAPEESWLYPAFLGLIELKRKGSKVNSFATIGTGPGIDSIGAYEIFHPKKIYQTDIHPDIPELADRNAKTIIGKKAEVQTFLGDLCKPLIQRKIRVDLVYGNLPNIPSDEPPLDGKKSASMFVKRDIQDCPDIFVKYQLILQYIFLKEAKNIVNPEGYVVDVLGDRVPHEVLEQLFTTNGYKVNELMNIYKAQSEPEEVLDGYVKAEREYGIEFDFYDHEKAKPEWMRIQNLKLSGSEIKESLKSFRLTATQAFKKFTEQNKTPGHLCSILVGQLK